MWVITCYEGSNISMYEYETETEAREACKSMKCCKVLSEIVYYNDSRFKELVSLAVAV